MKETKYYSSDRGGILVGNSKFRTLILNYLGDGTSKVSVYSHDEDVPNNYIFKGTVEGDEINIYKEDCLLEEDLEKKKYILFTLSGIYCIYFDIDTDEFIFHQSN